MKLKSNFSQKQFLFEESFQIYGEYGEEIKIKVISDSRNNRLVFAILHWS
jgi:hypothetical protein